MLRYPPAVFCVGDEYQIMTPVTGESLFRVKVGDRYFYDEQNGIMRSLTSIHRVSVPMELLDRAGKYTVCERELIDRKPYFPETRDEVETEFAFSPLPADHIRIYHVADAHNHVAEPVTAARVFGDFDLLVLNGDIPNHCGEVACMDTVYALAAELTGGRIPIVFARGNHDMRGYHAEEFADYTPSQNGHTYYTLRVGSLWMLILDCGEDKLDHHAEYGYTVACHDFRLRQTDLIRRVIRDAATEYDAPGVTHKLVVCHNPFTHRSHPPFDIEEEIFTEWGQLLRDHIKPDLMLCGHLHRCSVTPVGGPLDQRGQPCPLIVGSGWDGNIHEGCGITLRRDEATVTFCKGNGETRSETVEL